MNVIESQAFISDTNRSPIMVVDNGKICSLEKLMKEAIGNNLNVITGKYGSRYGWGYGREKVPTHVKNVGSMSVKEVSPHIKRIKITIEVEE